MAAGSMKDKPSLQKQKTMSAGLHKKETSKTEASLKSKADSMKVLPLSRTKTMKPQSTPKKVGTVRTIQTETPKKKNELTKLDPDFSAKTTEERKE